jgi:hypothetical protein
MKREPGAWVYNWATLSLDDINIGPCPPRWGLDAKLRTVLCTITVAKSKEVKIGCNLTESSKEGYGSKRAVLPMMMMNMYINVTFLFPVLYCEPNREHLNVL